MNDDVKSDELDPLNKARFDYAWKWFEFHARQRTTLLNFFLIIVGVFFAAYGTLYQARIESPGPVSTWAIRALLGLGALASLLFLMLDLRNRTLVHLAEDILERLEKEFFKWPTCDKQDLHDEDPTKEYLGILIRETRTNKTVCEKKKRLLWLGRMSFLSKHGFVITVLQVTVCLAFTTLLYVDVQCLQPPEAPKPVVEAESK